MNYLTEFAAAAVILLVVIALIYGIYLHAKNKHNIIKSNANIKREMANNIAMHFMGALVVLFAGLMAWATYLELNVTEDERRVISQKYLEEKRLKASMAKPENTKSDDSKNIDHMGRNKIIVCRNYAEARQSCATASDYGRCMDIKDKNRSPYTGEGTWYTDKDLCNPDGSLMWHYK